MNDDKLDAIDALLREAFEGPVSDDGFCDHVMARLPARRHRRTWPLAAGGFAGVAMCWTSLWFASIPTIGWRDWLSGNPSGSTVALFAAMLGMAILATLWSITEADDRIGPSLQLTAR